MSHAALLAMVLAIGGGDDCAQCTGTALCATHQAAQSAAVKELKPKLRSKDLADRTSTLVKLAELNAQYPSLPSADAADAVASALADESLKVRSEAARLLGDGMHPEVAVRSLVGALEDVRKEMAKLGGGRFGPPPDDDGKVDPKVAEARKKREETTEFARTVVESLGKLRDDRCVQALAELLPQLTRRNGGELIRPTAEALLAFEARAGVEAVIEKIKFASAGGGGGGRGGGGGGRWGPDTTGKTLHDLLLQTVNAKGLEGAPPWSTDDPPDWEAWFAKNQKHFPAKLGKAAAKS